MSLIDDAKQQVWDSFRPTRPGDLDGIGLVDMFLGRLFTTLTADGPVILVPDEGEGVRVAKLDDIRSAVERGDQFHSWLDDLIDAAREVAE